MEQLEEFAGVAAGLLPGLERVRWQELVEDDSASTAGSPDAEGCRNGVLQYGSQVSARDEAGMAETGVVVHVQTQAFAVELASN